MKDEFNIINSSGEKEYFGSRDACHLVAITNYFLLGGWQCCIVCSEKSSPPPKIVQRFLCFFSGKNKSTIACVNQKCQMLQLLMDDSKHKEFIESFKEAPPSEIWQLYRWFAEAVNLVETYDDSGSTYVKHHLPQKIMYAGKLSNKRRAFMHDSKLFPSWEAATDYIKNRSSVGKPAGKRNAAPHARFLMAGPYEGLREFNERFPGKKITPKSNAPTGFTRDPKTGALKPRIIGGKPITADSRCVVSRNKIACSNVKDPSEIGGQFVWGGIATLLQDAQAAKVGSTNLFAYAFDPNLCVQKVRVLECNCDHDPCSGVIIDVIDDPGRGVLCGECKGLIAELEYNWNGNVVTNGRPWVDINAEWHKKEYSTKYNPKSNNYSVEQNHSEALVHFAPDALTDIYLCTNNYNHEVNPAEKLAIMVLQAEAYACNRMTATLQHKHVTSGTNSPVVSEFSADEMVKNLFICLNSTGGLFRLKYLKSIIDDNLGPAILYLYNDAIAKKIVSDFCDIDLNGDKSLYHSFYYDDNNSYQKQFIQKLLDDEPMSRLFEYTEGGDNFFSLINCFMRVAVSVDWVDRHKVMLWVKCLDGKTLRSLYEKKFDNVIIATLLFGEDEFDIHLAKHVDEEGYHRLLKLVSKDLRSDIDESLSQSIEFLAGKLTKTDSSSMQVICDYTLRSVNKIYAESHYNQLSLAKTLSALFEVFLTAMNKCGDLTSHEDKEIIFTFISSLLNSNGGDNSFDIIILKRLLNDPKILINKVWSVWLLYKVATSLSSDCMTLYLAKHIISTRQSFHQSSNDFSYLVNSLAHELHGANHFVACVEKVLSLLIYEAQYLGQDRPELILPKVISHDGLPILIKPKIFSSISVPIPEVKEHVQSYLNKIYANESTKTH